MLVATMIGLFDNPYAGLVVFVAVPAVLICRTALHSDRHVAAAPQALAASRNGRRLADLGLPPAARAPYRVLLFTALGTLTAAIALVAGYGSLHYMESPTFCGQACHTPMQPQFTAWQAGPHARIACVNCHVGEGARGMVQAKLAGTRQLVHVITGSGPAPGSSGADVPFGGHDLTCGRCHQPMKIPGDVIRVKREYADDEQNTETTTILMMHVGPRQFDRTLDSLARRSLDAGRVRVGRYRAPEDYLREGDVAGREGEGVLRRRRRRQAGPGGVAAGHGLRGLPQHGRPSHRHRAGAGRGRGARRRRGEPQAAVRAARRRPAAQGVVQRATTTRRAGSTRSCVVSTRRKAARSTRSARSVPSPRCRAPTAATCSRHEGVVGHLSRQHGPHGVAWLLPLPRRIEDGEGRLDDQQRLRVLPPPGRTALIGRPDTAGLSAAITRHSCSTPTLMPMRRLHASGRFGPF